MIDPRTPVLVGAAQRVDRDSAPGEGRSPPDMLADVARAAVADSSGRDVVAAIDAIAVVRLFQDSGFAAPFGQQANLPWSLARRLGASPARLFYGPVGGHSPQLLATRFMADIAAGRHDVVLLAGCEVLRTQSRALKAGIRLDWAEDAPAPPETVAREPRMTSAHELAHGIALPAHVYPLFENAIGHRSGRSAEAHLAAIGRLMAGFSRVAAANPFAQLPVARTAEEIVTPSPDNRIIAWPYTKYLVANMFVDQAAALLLMSVAAADRLGVPADRRVFLHGAADVAERLLVSDRVDYHSSPAIRIGARAALDAAGVGVAALDHVDLYSCFPSAVQIASEEIGLPLDPPERLTLTGGLPYFGGPGNNYSMHAIAEAAARCRARPGSRGFVFANGGYLTKHSFGLWSSTPRPFATTDSAALQRAVDSVAVPAFTERPEGEGVIETFTVVHDRGEPAFAILIGRSADGCRFLAQLHAGCAALMAGPAIGRPIRVTAGDPVNRAELA